MERKKKFVRQKKNPLLKSKKKIKKKKKMKRIVIMRKNKENPTIEKLLLEKNFLNSHKEIVRLHSLNLSQLAKYLYKKGFKEEAKKIYNNKIDVQSFICLMTCQEGLKFFEEDLHFSKDAIVKLQELYKNIHIFRKKFCSNFQLIEEPFY